MNPEETPIEDFSIPPRERAEPLRTCGSCGETSPNSAWESMGMICPKCGTPSVYGSKIVFKDDEAGQPIVETATLDTETGFSEPLETIEPVIAGEITEEEMETFRRLGDQKPMGKVEKPGDILNSQQQKAETVLDESSLANYFTKKLGRKVSPEEAIEMFLDPTISPGSKEQIIKDTLQ